jgi:hypothetical protein
MPDVVWEDSDVTWEDAQVVWEDSFETVVTLEDTNMGLLLGVYHE